MASFQRPAFWRVPRNDDTDARRSVGRPTSNGYQFNGYCGGNTPKKVHFIDEVKLFVRIY